MRRAAFAGDRAAAREVLRYFTSDRLVNGVAQRPSLSWVLERLCATLAPDFNRVTRESL
jgi:hypothetical protein